MFSTVLKMIIVCSPTELAVKQTLYNLLGKENLTDNEQISFLNALTVIKIDKFDKVMYEFRFNSKILMFTIMAMKDSDMVGVGIYRYE